MLTAEEKSLLNTCRDEAGTISIWHVLSGWLDSGDWMSPNRPNPFTHEELVMLERITGKLFSKGA